MAAETSPAPDVSAQAAVSGLDVPYRLDRLPWSAWHRRVIIALGITWTLDGLEASLIAALGPILQDARTLGLTNEQIGYGNAAYLAGEVAGALFFGWLTDQKGRKKLFLVTLALYLAATALGGLSPNLVFFAVCRFFAGAGIGGEYSAINSAIDEIVPAKVRGQVDLAINGTYWLGVVFGALLTRVLLNPAIVPIEIGWRFAFGLGALLGLVILVVRRAIPESPRWLLLHGRNAEADAITREIEEAVYGAERIPAVPDARWPAPRAQGGVALRELFHALLVQHPKRTVLGLSLMVAQSFFYNAIFFSYGLILAKYYGVAPASVGLYMIPFAIGNFIGPLVLGPLFDRWGRRVMIPLTYAMSGLLLLGTGYLFTQGVLSAATQTACWCVVFFFASSAASAAYLTVSELFPLHIRGLAIAVFFAVATLVAAAAPIAFGKIIDEGSPAKLFLGYALAAVMMLAAAVVARVLGIDAEGRSLEDLQGHHPEISHG